MQLGQLVHAVIVLAGVENERNQHRVVDRANLDAMPAEHRHVVLDVLADLQHRRVFQQRLQLFDRGLDGDLPLQQLARILVAAVAQKIERALRGCAGDAMHQRQVGGAPARRVDVAPRSLQQGQRHADQAGIVGIESIGLAVERHRARTGRLGDPFVEQLLVLDHLVVGRGEVPVGLLRGRSCGGRRGFGLLHRRGRGGRSDRRIGLAQLAGEPLQ